MQNSFWRLAPLYLSACLMMGCESGASKSSLRDETGTARSASAGFSSPGEAVQIAERLRLAGAEVEALAVLAEASRRYPQERAVKSAYGRLALAMGHDELAERHLQTAIAADPQDWRALSAQGVLDWRRGRASEARGRLIQAKAMSAEDSAVLNNLAVGYLLEGRAGEAASLLRQALASASLKPAHAGRIRRNLALALAVEGNFAEADRLAAATMPRSLKHADAGAIRRFMGISDAAASRTAWAARLADAGSDRTPGQ